MHFVIGVVKRAEHPTVMVCERPSGTSRFSSSLNSLTGFSLSMCSPCFAASYCPIAQHRKYTVNCSDWCSDAFGVS